MESSIQLSLATAAMCVCVFIWQGQRIHLVGHGFFGCQQEFKHFFPTKFDPILHTMGLQPESSRVCSSASASIWPEVVLAALARTL